MVNLLVEIQKLNFFIGFQNFLRMIVPKGIWINFTSAGFESLDISRMGIWRKSLNFIMDNK